MDKLRTVCPHDCPDTCSIIANVENGKLISTKGDPEHPFTRGVLCAKVLRYNERIYSPDRVLYPMKRVGKKGEGVFEKISWDEALDTIAEKVQQAIKLYGGEAVYAYKGTGTLGLIQSKFHLSFFNKIGATLERGSLCCPASDEGWKYTVGPNVINRPESVAETDLLIIWGMNMATTNLHMLSFVHEAKKNGAQVIVIDPYRNRTAKQADWYLPIRPGTDAALALGIMNVLAEQNLLDRAYIDKYSIGFTELIKELPNYTPEQVEAITGVPAEQIKRLAMLYGKARAPFIRIGMGVSRNRRGGMSVRTISCLPGLVGAYHKRGGGAFLSSSSAFPLNSERIKRSDFVTKPLRTLNKVQWGQSLLKETNPPITIFFVTAGNPAASNPNAGLVREGLLRQDLFTIVHEQFMTDTALYADLLLPATTSFEAFDVYQSYGHTFLQKAEPVIEPLGEAWSNQQFYSTLARKMGFTDDIFIKSIEQLAEELLPDFISETKRQAFHAGKPIELVEIGEVFQGDFSTPSRKLEFFSEQMVNDGYPGLPTYTELDDEGAGDLHLLTPPAHHTLNTSFGGVATLREKEQRPMILIHPDDALQREISEDCWVEVFNDKGSVRLWAKITEDTQRGVIAAEGVWWSKHTPDGRLINILTNDSLTDMGWGSTLHDNKVFVRRLV